MNMFFGYKRIPFVVKDIIIKTNDKKLELKDKENQHRMFIIKKIS